MVNTTLPAVVAHVDHLQRRVVREAIRDAESWQWQRRAAEWEAAAPRRGDFHGRATREALQARHERCVDAARTCRARAAVSILQGVVW